MFVDITWYEEKMVELATGKATLATSN
jgi:hypothetical protein